MSSLHSQIQERLQQGGVAPDCASQAAHYGVALLEINEHLNLTGAKTFEDLVDKHLLDTFLAIQAMGTRSWPGEVWDIGSGGGIPGIPLALFLPHLRVHLVEKRQKKANALKSLVDACGLAGRVRVSAGTFEALKPFPKDIEIWFRGFLPGIKLIQYFSDHFKSGELGPIVLMKGPAWEEEKAGALGLNKISPYWRQRFLDCSKIEYALPRDLGRRSLIKI